jgi:hypothetical protein
MDADSVIWLLVIAFWILSGLAQMVKKMFGKGNDPRLDPSERPAGGASTRRAADTGSQGGGLREVLEQLGKELQGELQKAAGQEPTPPPPPPVPSAAERASRPATEQPVVAEHRRTASEHRPTPGEHRRTAGEHRRTLEEHRQAPGEARVPVGEHLADDPYHMPTPSEHRGTPGEHRRGDVRITPRPPAAAYRGPSARRSRFARRLVADLRGDRRSLARAMVLKEILGPPLSLRTPGEERR